MSRVKYNDDFLLSLGIVSWSVLKRQVGIAHAPVGAFFP